MKIKAQIDRMFNSDNNIKASASVNIGGNFIVRGFTVMNGKNGLFVKMPNRAYRDQNGEIQHSETFFALNNEARNVLNSVIVAAYVSRRLKADFEKSSPLSSFSADLCTRTVKSIRLGTVSITLINGQNIGKEQAV